MEVLTAYVRQHARQLPEQNLEGAEEAAIQVQYKEDSWGELETTGLPTLDPDIQAIMTVLRRRTHSLGHGEPEPLDLRGADLSGADLFEANLAQANVSGADLRGADLSGAILSQEQLERTIGDEGTHLPDHLKPPAHWGVKADEQIEED